MLIIQTGFILRLLTRQLLYKNIVQKGKKKAFNFKQLLINFLIYPLMTLKIIGAIHYEALRLWKKGAKYRPRNNKKASNKE